MKTSTRAADLKDAAAGRWRDILVDVAGIAPEFLDGKHHPCPKCGGSDRFRLVDQEAGAVLCSQCFDEKNGDGISAVQWMLGCGFKDALERISTHLGIRPTKRRPEEYLSFRTWIPELASPWAAKKGVSLEALRAFGAELATYRDAFGTISLPIRAPGKTKPAGFLVVNRQGGLVSTAKGEQTKILTVANSKTGWVGTCDRLEEAPVVWKCEGPTDALALWDAMPPELREGSDQGAAHAVVTNPYGASERPQKEHLASCAGKVVVIVADSDDTGKAGADRWSGELAKVAERVRVVSPPGAKDLREWLQSGHTFHELYELARAAPLAGAKDFDVLTNFTEEVGVDENGKAAMTKTRLREDQIVSDLFELSGGWPKKLGADLFWDNRGRADFISTPMEFDSWTQIATKTRIKWASGTDSEGAQYLTRRELFGVVMAQAEVVEDITEHPLEPMPAGVYVTSRGRCTSPGKGGIALDGFVRLFAAASDEDYDLLAAFVLTLFWGGPPGARPLFVFTGAGGVGEQAIGKTTAVRLLSSLAGGAYSLDLGQKADPVKRQLASDDAIRYRCALIDNAEGYLRDRDVAELVTSEWVNGRPTYGKQRQRANRLTWAVTSVSPALSSDLSSRAFLIQLAKPERDPDFEGRVTGYVAEHRDEIVGDVLAHLRGEILRCPVPPVSRFAQWEREVLSCFPSVSEILASRADRIDTIDEDDESLERFLNQLQTDYQIGRTLLQPKQLAAAWETANGMKVYVGRVVRLLNEYRARGKLVGVLEPAPGKKHGKPWIFHRPEDGFYS